jgi:putative transposase
MLDIMVVLACLSQCAQPTTLRQLRGVIEAMLSISGRVTMRGLSRWSGKGVSGHRVLTYVLLRLPAEVSS